MRCLSIVVFVLAAALSPASSRAFARDEAPDVLLTTLTQMERDSWVAWQKRDGAFFERFLSNDHVEVGTGGPIGKSAVVAGVYSPTCTVKSYAVDQFKLTSFDAQFAVLTYHAQQDTTCGGLAVPSPVWVSSLFVFRDGRWQNALYQQTRSPK